VKQDSRRLVRRWCWLSLAGCVFFASACSRHRGDTLAEVQRRGSLRWGGDEEGGGPYIYRPEEDTKILAGFEIDLLELLSQRLGVKSDFQSSNWPELLNTLMGV
jgi:polar amino acid transport system substrate-binding protein